jgi:hypothetical protein
MVFEPVLCLFTSCFHSNAFNMQESLGTSQELWLLSVLLNWALQSLRLQLFAAPQWKNNLGEFCTARHVVTRATVSEANSNLKLNIKFKGVLRNYNYAGYMCH